MTDAYVRDDGCVGLGSSVTCDGFSPDAPVRIQTHVHQDHLKDFDRSKGRQRRIIMSPETRELLIAEYNADLPLRRTQLLAQAADGQLRPVESVRIALFPSGHMVGGVMALVEDDSKRYAYTSDFSWPLYHLPTDVDVLVVDATYGDPAYQRNYDEATVVERLIELVVEKMALGPVVISGHRGRLQFAAALLAGAVKHPLLVSRSLMKTLPTYAKQQGLCLDVLHSFDSAEAKHILGRNGCFLGFVETRDRHELLQSAGATRILLSAYMVPGQEPVLVHANGLIRVALTDHADFRGTLNLIEAVAPRNVIADGSRGGDGECLAQYVRRELKIPARADYVRTGLGWGGTS